MTDKKSMWEEAGRAGLILGGVSAAYLALSAVTGSVSPDNTGMVLIAGAANIILWVAKFTACIMLMKHFMKKRSANVPEAGNSDIFRFGCAVAFLSALVYSACYLAYVKFIAPDTFSNVLELLQDNPMMDSNSLAAAEEMLPKMSGYLFFFNLFYCWLFGTVLSAIFSRNIPPVNPFKGFNDNNIDNQ